MKGVVFLGDRKLELREFPRSAMRPHGAAVRSNALSRWSESNPSRNVN